MPRNVKKKIAKEEKKLDHQQQVYLEDMFNSIYSNRRQIYVLNFFRGVFFGLGTFLGGTVVIAILVWFLGQLNAPFIEKLLNAIDKQL